MALTVNVVVEVGVESKGSCAPLLREKGSLPRVPARHHPQWASDGLSENSWRGAGRERKDVAGQEWVWLGSGLMGVSEAGPCSASREWKVSGLTGQLLPSPVS